MILWIGISALTIGILLLIYGVPDVVNNPGFFASVYLAISILGVILTGMGVVLTGLVIIHRKKVP
jgi:hypothetical protein